MHALRRLLTEMEYEEGRIRPPPNIGSGVMLWRLGLGRQQASQVNESIDCEGHHHPVRLRSCTVPPHAHTP